MLKATIKTAFLLLTCLMAIGLAGCSDPKLDRSESLENAKNLKNQGAYPEAIALLETQLTSYPDDPELLKGLGFIYEALGEPNRASNYLLQAHSLDSENIELTYQTYLATEASNNIEDARRLLELMAQRNPLTMNPELWQRLGGLRREKAELQPALDAYLLSIDSATKDAHAETAVAIGTIFLELKNLPQAEQWFKIAARQSDPNALPALLALLELKIAENEIEGAINLVDQLDEQFPGALDASNASTARETIATWQRAKEAEAESAAQKLAAKKAEAEASTEVQTIDDEAPVAATETVDVTTRPGKSELAEEVALIEALAEKPALEVAPEAPAPQTAQIIKAEREKTIDELISEADLATFNQDYDQTISLYWQILGRANTRADIWNQLSRAYLINGQLENAETTALESTRLAPEEIQYTLDYLRVAQRSKQPIDFLAELETAYDRFPSSPEVALSLARGYERISGDLTTARSLYQRFISLAPSHPLRPEAEEAINRLP